MPTPEQVTWRRAGSVRASIRKHMTAERAPCHVCGDVIDYDAAPATPAAFEIDHVVPLAAGGAPLDPSNLRPAHRECNRRKGTRSLESARPERRSRSW